MAVKVMSDLALRIDAQTAELKKELNKTNASFKSFSKKIDANSKSLSGNVKESFFKISAGIAVAVGVVKSFDKAINSTQGTGDAFAKMVGGMEGGLNAFMTSIMTADFSNLIDNVINANKAAKEYITTLDELGDVGRAVAVQTAEGQLRILILQVEIEKNKKSNPELARKQNEEILRITEESIKKSNDLSDRYLNAEIEKLRATYGLTKDQGDLLLDYIRKYDSLTVNELAAINEINQAKEDRINTEKALFDVQNNNVGALGGKEKAMLRLQENVNIAKKKENDLIASATDSTKAYMSISKATNLMTDEERQKVADLIINKYSSEKKMISYQKTAITMTETLNNEIEKELKSEKEISDEKAFQLKTLQQIKSLESNRIESKKTTSVESLHPQLPSTLPLTLNVETGADVYVNAWTAAYAEKMKLAKLDLENGKITRLEYNKIQIEATKELTESRRQEFSKWAQMASDAISVISTLTEASKQRELAAAGDNEKAKEAIEKRYYAKQKKQAIAQALINGALAITNMMANVPMSALNPATWVGIGIAGASTLAQVGLIQSQEFAQGGIVYGETLATVGEYSGARNNPEVIAPLDKLKTLLGDSNGGGGTVEFFIDGYQLKGILDKTNFKNSRI